MVPAQPRLLDHVLRAPHVSQHAVRERQHRGPVGLEDREILRRPLTQHQSGLVSMWIVTIAMVPHIDHEVMGADPQLARPTISCTCVWCSAASSMKAATARNDIENPSTGTASRLVRYASSGLSIKRGDRAIVQSRDVADTISSAVPRSRITCVSSQRKNAKRSPFSGNRTAAETSTSRLTPFLVIAATVLAAAS